MSIAVENERGQTHRMGLLAQLLRGSKLDLRIERVRRRQWERKSSALRDGTSYVCAMLFGIEAIVRASGYLLAPRDLVTRTDQWSKYTDGPKRDDSVVAGP